MKRLQAHLTYANVISTLCLFLILGSGAAFAATQLAKNSVGSKQLKKNAVTTAKIKNGAVTGAKIKLGSLGTVPSAANASKLDGADAASYRGRVAQVLKPGFGPSVQVPSNIATNVTPEGPSLSITVPAGVNFVVADASISFADPTSTSFTLVWVSADDATCGSSGLGYVNRTFGSISSPTTRDELNQHLVFPVTPGTHNYSLCAYSTGGEPQMFTRSLALQTVAGGPTG